MKQKSETWVEQLMERGFNLPPPPAPVWNKFNFIESDAVEELEFEQLDQLAAAGLKSVTDFPTRQGKLAGSK